MSGSREGGIVSNWRNPGIHIKALELQFNRKAVSQRVKLKRFKAEQYAEDLRKFMDRC